MKPTIIHEDEHILVVNKPSGLLVHPDGKKEGATLTDWILEQYPTMESVGEGMRLKDGTVIKRPGIVHRLDAETSGVLLLAKDQETFLHLKERFKERKVTKTYYTFVHGLFKEKEGAIDRSIGKSKKDFRQWSAQRGAVGTLREATTEYVVIEQKKDVAYLSVRPITGRTHQIRVHMKAIHHPVVCDRLYAPKHECVLGFERLALHAGKISLIHPKGEQMTFVAPFPEDFVKAKELFKAL